MAKKRVVSRSSYVDPNKVGKKKPTGGSKRVHQKIVESYWNCTSCGNSNIPGRIKVCPNCQNTKDKDEEYQQPERNAPALTQRELDEMGVDSDHSSDQTCEYCGAKSKPGTATCPHCNASLLDVARTGRVCYSCGQETNYGKCPSCGATTRSKNDQTRSSYYSQPVGQSSRYQPVKVRAYPKFKGVDLTSPYIWGPALGLLLIAILAFIFWPRHAEVQVQSVSWKAEIYLQEYQYNQHEGWSLPQGADLISTDSRIHHYDQVPDGTETVYYDEQVCEDVYSHTETTCYDDGTCDVDDVYRTQCHPEQRSREVPKYKDVPVYETYYLYKQWEWVNISPAVETGTNFEPYWPSGYLIDTKHRESGRKMTFAVRLIEPESGDDFTYNPDSLEEFKTFNVNSMWEITHTGKHITEIERIQR